MSQEKLVPWYSYPKRLFAGIGVALATAGRPLARSACMVVNVRELAIDISCSLLNPTKSKTVTLMLVTVSVFFMFSLS